MRYVDSATSPAQTFILTTRMARRKDNVLYNGRRSVHIVMPHPERVFRTVQMSWQPPQLEEDSPWMRMFRNARR